MEYGISDDDIYNIGETGFGMGLTSTSRVVTRAEYYGKRKLLQPDNQEWVTAIECISRNDALHQLSSSKGKSSFKAGSVRLPQSGDSI